MTHNGKLAISAQIRRFCCDSSLPSFDFIRQISNKISYLIFIFDHCWKISSLSYLILESFWTRIILSYSMPNFFIFAQVWARDLKRSALFIHSYPFYTYLLVLYQIYFLIIPRWWENVLHLIGCDVPKRWRLKEVSLKSLEWLDRFHIFWSSLALFISSLPN